VIVDSGKPLPRVHSDIVEMTTDETAATLAMPMPHLKKGAPSTPPLAPRLGPAAASIGGAGAMPTAPVTMGDPQRIPAVTMGDPQRVPQTPPRDDRRSAPPPPAPVEIQSPSTLIGPGGTQPVHVGRSIDHLAERRPDPAEDLRAGNLPAHPAGSYLSPAVRASLARSAAAEPPNARAAAALPNVFDEASSSQPGEAEVKTQLYRPSLPSEERPRVDAPARSGPAITPAPAAAPVATGASVKAGASVKTGTPGPRPPADSLAAASRPAPPAPARSAGVPLVLVLLGFLLVGFVVVAGVMVIFRR
jgi:hypothetical protein